MSEAIKVFDKNSKEYKRLEAAAKLIEVETSRKCDVENIMFDAGQNWMWTSLSIESRLSQYPSVQALNPRQQENIVFGDVNAWLEAVKEVIDANS